MTLRRKGGGAVAAPAVALAAVRDMQKTLRVGVDEETRKRERAEVERNARARADEESAVRERAREAARVAARVDHSSFIAPVAREVSAVPDVRPLLALCGATLQHAGEVLAGGDVSALHTVVSELRERERDARAFIDAWPADLGWRKQEGGTHAIYSAAQDVGGVVGMAAYYLAELGWHLARE